MRSFLSNVHRAVASPFALIFVAVGLIGMDLLLRLAGVHGYSVWTWMWAMTLLLASVAFNVASLVEYARWAAGAQHLEASERLRRLDALIDSVAPRA